MGLVQKSLIDIHKNNALNVKIEYSVFIIIIQILNQNELQSTWKNRI